MTCVDIEQPDAMPGWRLATEPLTERVSAANWYAWGDWAVGELVLWPSGRRIRVVGSEQTFVIGEVVTFTEGAYWLPDDEE